MTIYFMWNHACYVNMFLIPAQQVFCVEIKNYIDMLILLLKTVNLWTIYLYYQYKWVIRSSFTGECNNN